jgi:hypothetical protein
LPLELLDKRKLLENFLQNQKLKTQEKMNLVSLDGDCPDDKLLETEEYKGGKKENFEGRKRIDQRNESRPPI